LIRDISGRLPQLRGPTLRVLSVLRVGGPATRAEVASRTGLSRASVSAALAELRSEGLALETGESAPRGPGGGRPASLVRLGPRAGVVVGVDIGRQHLRVAVADLGHSVLTEAARSSPLGQDAPTVLDRAATMVVDALAGAGFALPDVVGVGMGLPAPVDPATGLITAPGILPQWSRLDPGATLAAHLGRPVAVENDANLGALAEYVWGAGRGSTTMVYVKAATGIGGGLILGGQLFRGASGSSGEIGHVTLDEHGAMCGCGNRGCLDVIAGGDALLAVMARTERPVGSVGELIRLAREGDAACRRVLADAGGHIGLALGSLVNLVNPDRIVIGGELGLADEILLEPIRLALRRAAIQPAVQAADVVIGQLGDRSEVLGAVARVLREPQRT
jgi:predicted NBD/HSP70 family sugar kinase